MVKLVVKVEVEKTPRDNGLMEVRILIVIDGFIVILPMNFRTTML